MLTSWPGAFPLAFEPLERFIERHRFSAHQPFELFGSKTAVKRARRLLFQTRGRYRNDQIRRAFIELHKRSGKIRPGNEVLADDVYDAANSPLSESETYFRQVIRQGRITELVHRNRHLLPCPNLAVNLHREIR